MQDLVVRAKALFAAQYAVTVTGQAYCAALSQVALNKKQTDDWQHAIDKLGQSEDNYRIFRLAMLDKLVQTRSWVLFDFRNYVSAYCFYSLDSNAPITLDALKDMGDWLSDAATLQSKIATAKQNIRAQERRFTITDNDTAMAMVLSPTWKDNLKSSRTFVFSITPTSGIFSNRARVRISSFQLFLEGAQVSAKSDSIRLMINFGRDLTDLSIAQPARLLSFVGAETKAGFEYAPKQQILMDGKLSYPENAVAITPFTTWTVKVDDYTDCSAVTGLTLNLTCQVTMLG